MTFCNESLQCGVYHISDGGLGQHSAVRNQRETPQHLQLLMSPTSNIIIESSVDTFYGALSKYPLLDLIARNLRVTYCLLNMMAIKGHKMPRMLDLHCKNDSFIF